MMQDEAMLTVQEAAAYLHVSRATVLRLVRSGKLAGHKVGSSWRFHREDVLSLVGREIPPSKESPAA